jgi:hypothetical protein
MMASGLPSSGRTYGRFAFTSAAVQVNSRVSGFQCAQVVRASWPLRVPQR